jgi:hypothetical protein
MNALAHGVRADGLDHASAAGDTPDDPGSAVTVEAVTVAGGEDRPGRTLTDGQVDGVARMLCGLPPSRALPHQWLCSGNPQAAAARTNSGDCSSIVLGKTRITPSISLITPTKPARSDGTEILGSGKSEIPCRRMHWATLSIFASELAEGGGPEPGPAGRNFWHFACAASNAGDERSVPAGSRKPPLALGSGKSGTPLERMHCANSNSCEAISPGSAGPDDPDVCDEACGWVVVVGPRPAGPAVSDEVPPAAPWSSSRSPPPPSWWSARRRKPTIRTPARTKKPPSFQVSPTRSTVIALDSLHSLGKSRYIIVSTYCHYIITSSQPSHGAHPITSGSGIAGRPVSAPVDRRVSVRVPLRALVSRPHGSALKRRPATRRKPPLGTVTRTMVPTLATPACTCARGRRLRRRVLGHLGGLGIFLVDRLRANAGPGGDPRPTVPSLA